jgi:membrane-associated protease RseP (regulator of RpoE activity)
VKIRSLRMSDMLDRLRTRKRLPLVNLALFLATSATTMIAGAWQYPASFETPASAVQLLLAGVPFAASLIGILLCHEMGHYLTARRYRVDSTLPFFIPAPIGIGTFGAVIRMRSAMPNLRATLDIGIAGPIAGLAVAIPLYAWGLAHSEIRAVGDVAAGLSSVGSPFAILRGLHRLADSYGSFGEAIRHRAELLGSGSFEIMGDSLITWLVQKWVVGPIPVGHDLFAHPVASAAWFGLLVTTLNLFPIGQLDGGHAIYALFGRRGAHLASRLVSAALFAAGFFFSWNWFIWWALTRFVVGLRHPPALQEEPLAPGRRALAIAALVLFAATFIPVPMSA